MSRAYKSNRKVKDADVDRVWHLEKQVREQKITIENLKKFIKLNTKKKFAKEDSPPPLSKEPPRNHPNPCPKCGKDLEEREIGAMRSISRCLSCGYRKTTKLNAKKD